MRQLLGALLVVGALAACGGGGDDDANGDAARSASTTSTTEASDSPVLSGPSTSDTTAATPEKAEAARTLVSATRKQARFKPAEMVLREVLEAAFVVMDEDFMPSLGRNAASGEGEMT